MKSFAMTCDRWHFWTPVVLTPFLLIPLALPRLMPQPVAGITAGAIALTWAVLVITTLMAPREVMVTFGELELVRLAWPSFRIPLHDVEVVERGPVIARGAGVVRLMGVGGWFWSGGLFRVRNLGNVRAWMTRLGPTLVLRRKEGLPILLGVDDVPGLLATLGQRGFKVQ
jgi:hypothetical protein